jgi:protease IV
MVDPAKVVDLFKDARDRRSAPLILELDLTEGLLDGQPTDPVSAVLSLRRAHMRDVLDGLRRARTDPRVTALIAKIGTQRLGLARCQELRDAVQAFRDAGKHTVAWTESFGETGRGTVPYYLASVFERIYMQPSGDLAITGVALEEPFFNEALHKLGVSPQFAKRHEYKSAANIMVEREYTPAHREMSERLVASIGEQLVAGVASSRGLTESRVRELIDQAPLVASEALDAGLIDGLAYRDEIYAELRRRVDTGAEARLRYVSRYSRSHTLTSRLPLPRPHHDAIALIHGNGPIRLGRSGRSALPGQGAAIGSDTVGAAFRAAVADDKVKAIVFRVDSPGGSYVASDTIWREVVLARKAGLPVVVSMGNVAASGGYFVAAPADTIVAQPGTLTGSIGVVFGKQVVDGLMKRVGIGLGTVEQGAHARIYSATREFTAEEWARIDLFLDRVYADFTSKVATGRNLSAERVDELARGRVWTGADAHERGLVDELGGLDLAVELARKKARLPDSAVLRDFPHASPLDRLRTADSSEDRTAARARLDAWGPLSGIAVKLGLPMGGPLMLSGNWDVS